MCNPCHIGETLIRDSKNGADIDNMRFVPLEAISAFIAEIRREEQAEKDREELTKPIKKFLFVEDGSVDCDELTEDLSIKNSEIKVVVYRAGAREPQLIDVTNK